MKRVLLGLAAAALLLAGCGGSGPGAGIGKGLSVTCDGTTRVYTWDGGSYAGGLAVIPNDPRCGGTP